MKLKDKVIIITGNSRPILVFFLLAGACVSLLTGTLIAEPPANLRLVDLQCEHLTNPLGVDVAQPRLSWKILDDRRGVKQQTYRVLVASSAENLAAERGDVWDSERVESSETTEISLPATGLKPDHLFHWKVQIWDGQGKASAWSEPAWFRTGLFADVDWKGAEWIAWRSEERYQAEWAQRKEKENVHPKGENLGKAFAFWPGNRKSIWEIHGFNNPPYDPAPLLRKEFQASKKVRSAQVYVCGLGYHEIFLNGKRVGDHVLDPGWTDFSKRVLYVSHDVTNLVKNGGNALGVMLGRGWYNPTSNDINALELNWWRGQPMLLLRLSIEFDDGTRQDVTSDTSWKVAGGPVIFDCPRHGEIYDSSQEKSGWNLPGFADSSWENVQPAPAPKGKLEAQLMPPIREIRTIKPVKMFELEPGVFVFEFPEMISGWPRIKLRGPAGTKVRIVMAEDPDPKTYEDMPPHHGAAGIQQFGHILKGDGEEIAAMRFCYKSFQFVRVSTDGAPLKMTLDDVEGVVVHTDVESISEFSCSDPLLNRIHENVRRTFLNNYHSIQTDNPHREKYGWMGDIMVTAPAALANFDMTAFYEKHIQDVEDTQQANGHVGPMAPAVPWPTMPHLPYAHGMSPVWSSAFWSVAWDVYVQTGDSRIFANHYPAMKRFIEAIKTVNEIPGKPDIIGETHSDWNAVNPPAEYGGRPPEGGSVYGTAYFAQANRTLAKMARVLGETAEAEKFDAAADRIRDAFNREFFDAKQNIYHGENPTSYRQAANAVALRFDLVPEDRRAAVLGNLVREIGVNKGHLDTGLLGTTALFEMLPGEGEAGTALGMLQKRTYPGLGFMIESRQATTVWEQWQANTSLTQPALGSPDSFFIRHLAGIRADESQPGYKHAIIKPYPVGDLTWAKGEFISVRGLFASKWERKDGQFLMSVEIPANTSAEIWVPAKSLEDVIEGNHPATESAALKFIKIQEGYAVFEALSGSYDFKVAGGPVASAASAVELHAVGSGGSGVAVGKSALIAEVDASDTFTTGLDDDYRNAAYSAPWVVMNTLELDGKRSVTWQMPGNGLWVATSTKSSSSQTEYPGETGAGSDTGVTESGLMDAAWGIPYGQRSNFVVQFDAVVPTDRVAMMFGPGASSGAPGLLTPKTLSVLIRPDGAAIWLFRGDTSEGVDTGLSSSLPKSEINRWHNFAAKVDVSKNTVEVFVDQVSLGTIDVGALAPGFSWDASAVGYGLRSPGDDRLWSDNFQIGSPVSAEKK